MTAGDIYTVAGGGKGRVEDGGPATGARLLRPAGVAAGPGAASWSLTPTMAWSGPSQA